MATGTLSNHILGKKAIVTISLFYAHAALVKVYSLVFPCYLFGADLVSRWIQQFVLVLA